MENRPRRAAAKRSAMYGYNEWEKCKLIEKQEYLLQLKKSKGNNEDSAEFHAEEKRLRQLRNHICNNHYVNLEDYADEDLLLDYYPLQRPVKPRKYSRRKKNKEDADYSVSRYDTKDNNKESHSKRKRDLDDESHSSHMLEDHDPEYEDTSQADSKPASMKKVFTYQRKCPKPIKIEKETSKDTHTLRNEENKFDETPSNSNTPYNTEIGR